MSYLANNNAYGRLAAGLAESSTTLTLEPGQGDRFPVIAEPDYTFVTIEDAAGNREIVKVIERNAASDVLSIIRGQEKTVARAWNATDVVELRMVARLVEDAMAHPEKTSAAHKASAISAPAIGQIPAGTVQSQIEALETGKEPKFETLGFAKGGTGAKSPAEARKTLGIEAAETTVQTVANAATDIGAVASQNILLTTGAATITGFAAAETGVFRRIRVSTGGITLVHSSSFLLPGNANIAVASGDSFEAYCTGSAWIVRNYQRADSAVILASGKKVEFSGSTYNMPGAELTVNGRNISAPIHGGISLANLKVDAYGRVTSASVQAASYCTYCGYCTYCTYCVYVAPPNCSTCSNN